MTEGRTQRGPFDPTRLFLALDEARIDYVLVGGLAVGAHGAPRATRDVDICPNPDEANLARLADFLRLVNARAADATEFAEDELPPHDLGGLKAGGNFRLHTDLGPLDVMQFLEPFDERMWATLDAHAEQRHLAGVRIRVCGYEDLLRMKEAAGRDQDRIDVSNLKAARSEL